MQQQKTFHFYTDPGHGWLAVKKQFLETLGIAAQITPYSYQHGDTAYLEEDCDMTVFLQALKKTGIEVEITIHHTDQDSRIRSYASYRYSVFNVVATVYDPRCDKSDHFGAQESVNLASRSDAQIQARQWARDGYWASVYCSVSGEALYDFPPHGGVQ